jgi:hypothetical protein
MALLALALALTLVIEVPIVALFYPGQRLRMGLACAVATSITNVALNFALLRQLFAFDTTLLVGETLALVFEALVYIWMAPARGWPRALAASAAANLASFGVGLIFF